VELEIAKPEWEGTTNGGIKFKGPRESMKVRWVNEDRTLEIEWSCNAHELSELTKERRQNSERWKRECALFIGHSQRGHHGRR
jgi:hypothetical protein